MNLYVRERMSRILLVGDCHGYAGFLEIAKIIQTEKPDAVIQLGDAWDIPDQASNFGAPIHIIPGNHEQWDVWAKALAMKKSTEPNQSIILHWDYETFVIDNVKFGVIGRITDSRKVRDLQAKGLFLGEGPNKYHAELDGHTMRQKLGGSNVLLFHDAPFPFVFGRAANPHDIRNTNSYIAWIGERADIAGSDYLANVIKSLKTHPKLAFHGHMHLTCIRYVGQTLVWGLPPIDPVFLVRGYAILDTATLSVQFHWWRAVE